MTTGIIDILLVTSFLYAFQYKEILIADSNKYFANGTLFNKAAAFGKEILQSGKCSKLRNLANNPNKTFFSERIYKIYNCYTKARLYFYSPCTTDQPMILVDSAERKLITKANCPQIAFLK